MSNKLPDYINGKPITVYNCEKKEVVGIFASIKFIVKYFRPNQPENASSHFTDALKRGARIHKHNFNFPIALRFANENQIKELGNNQIVIKNNYPPINTHQVKIFNSTRESLYKSAIEKLK